MIAFVPSSKIKVFIVHHHCIQNSSSHVVSLGLCSGQQALPRRVFAPMPISGLSVCDYMFPDESTADVAERLKEMLDCETPEEDIDTSLENNQCRFPYFTRRL